MCGYAPLFRVLIRYAVVVEGYVLVPPLKIAIEKRLNVEWRLLGSMSSRAWPSVVFSHFCLSVSSVSFVALFPVAGRLASPPVSLRCYGRGRRCWCSVNLGVNLAWLSCAFGPLLRVALEYVLPSANAHVA